MTPMKYLPYLILFLLLPFTACEKETVTRSYTQAERDAVENYVQSASTIDATLSILNSYRRGGNILGQIVSLRQLGKLYRENSLFYDAIDYHQEGLKLATQVCDTVEMVQALNNIGTNYRRLGSLEEAASYHQQAMRLSTSQSDQSSKQAIMNLNRSLNGMGNVLMGLENYEYAEKIFRQALISEQNEENYLGRAINLANIGSVKMAIGQKDSAHYYYEQSLEMNKKAGSQNGIGICHIRFGELKEAEGQLDDAIKEYQTAYDILRQISDDWHGMEAVLSIAHICIEKGSISDAQHYLELARKTILRTGAQDQQVRVYELYYELYEKTGNARLALENYKLAKELKDSLVNTEVVTNVQNQRLANDRLQQEQLLVEANEKAATEHLQKRTFIIISIIILILLLALIITMWYSFRQRTQKQRMVHKMQKEREEFITNIAHEFHTPISTIITMAEQLEHDEAKDAHQVQSSARMIKRQATSLLGLINKILGKS